MSSIFFAGRYLLANQAPSMQESVLTLSAHCSWKMVNCLKEK